MNWLIIQSAGIHTGHDGLCRNDYLRECFAFAHAVRRLGDRALVWGLRHTNYSTPPAFEAFDVILCLENYETEWLPDLRFIRGPVRSHWIIDLHVQDPSVYAPISRGCDVVLHSTRRLMDGYRARFPGIEHHWFPNAVDDRYFNRDLHPRRERSIEALFVGSPHHLREEFMCSAEQRIGLDRRFATGLDMIDAILSAKVHFNRNIAGDINYRTFETIGLGSCLVTDADPDLAELGFIDGTNCLLYGDIDEAIDKVRWALRDDRWRSIAELGYRLSKVHSYTERLRAFRPVIERLLARPCHSRRRAA